MTYVLNKDLLVEGRIYVLNKDLLVEGRIFFFLMNLVEGRIGAS